ncbi:uncharacterized protein LOC118744128 [Rhagoletis pomonella]|uniref:uncharacterized protein LOC118744128 n=1 Tax=Rhagoletis pomonella TaxID=28610 RepID=UPI00177CF023|nr:uncharacterized protein LOC118744128 [Rhagoletis pomonella]
MGILTYTKEIRLKLMNKLYDAELANLNKQKYNLYRIALETGAWSDYNTIKRRYKRMVKVKKVKYLEHKITVNIGDSKSMWKHLKNCISMSKEINAINKVLIHNNLYTTENEIAQSLNNYFIDSIIEITSNIEPGKKESFTTPNCTHNFKFIEIETDEVLEIVSGFKNKIGGKKLLSEGVIKDSITYTGYFYTQLINESLKYGVVPDHWKTSIVEPIEKVKNTIRADEMRPINTLRSDEKILESLVLGKGTRVKLH